MFKVNEKNKTVIARIYNELKVCTQSGKGKQDIYTLEFFCPQAKYREPLMGWVASNNTLEEIKIKFSSLEAAKRFAQQNKIHYELDIFNSTKFVPKRYSDNFK